MVHHGAMDFGCDVVSVGHHVAGVRYDVLRVRCNVLSV